MYDAKCKGAVVNMDNWHWVGLIYHQESVWWVDNRFEPEALTAEQYRQKLHRFPNTYPVIEAKRPEPREDEQGE